MNGKLRGWWSRAYLIKRLPAGSVSRREPSNSISIRSSKSSGPRTDIALFWRRRSTNDTMGIRRNAARLPLRDHVLKAEIAAVVV